MSTQTEFTWKHGPDKVFTKEEELASMKELFPPSRSHPQSKEAAKQKGKSKAATDRTTILGLIEAHKDGLTRKELSHLTGMPIQSVCPRVWELLTKTTPPPIKECGKRKVDGSNGAILVLV